MLLPATFLLASFQLALSADETSCQLSGAGAFVPCAVEELVTNAGVSKRLDASLYCPRDSVTQLGFIETTQAELCTCDVDIYDPESPADTGETVDCQCYVCPDGLPQGAAFTCESEIVGSCSSVNCFGECDGDTSIDFLRLAMGFTDEAADTSCQVTAAGDFIPCPVEELVTYDGVLEKLLDASLYCPRESVTQLGFVDTTQAGLCTCDVDIYDPDSDATAGTVDCECYACPDGLAQATAFICESEIVGPCSSFNCFGECNGDTSIDFLQTGPVTPTANPTATPTATPTQADSAAQNFMFNPSICLAGFAIAGVLR